MQRIKTGAVGLVCAWVCALSTAWADDSAFGRAQSQANSFEARMQSLQRNAWSAKVKPMRYDLNHGTYGDYLPRPPGVPIAEVQAWLQAHPEEARQLRRDAMMGYFKKTYASRDDRAVAGLNLVEDNKGLVELEVGWALLQEAAEAGHGQAADQVAMAAYYGHRPGQPVDNDKAVKYAQLGAQQGRGVSQYLLGRQYFFGNGVVRDRAKAAELLRAAASGKPPVESALLDLAQIRFDGSDGQPASRDEAVALLTKAEPKGSDAVRVRLGRLMFRNDQPKLSENNQLAYGYLQRAAANKHPEGLFVQGLFLLAGQGVAADTAGAIALMTQAAEAGSEEAMVTLGNLYGGDNKRYGITQDAAKSFQWMERAAKAGSADGLYNMSIYYHVGGPVPQDKAKAAAMVKEAADRGHPGAQIRHGVNLVESGDTATVKQGVAYFARLAANGNSEAMSLLGQVTGLGVPGLPADVAIGQGWMRKAAAAGNGDAMFRLAQYYEKGRMGLPVDEQQAIDWRVKAADAGNEDAAFAAAWVHIKGLNGYPVDFAKANTYLALAGRKMPWAKNILAVHHFRGQGTPKDEARAFELWKEAARAGEKTSQEVLRNNNMTW